jgi:hypothetical protein
MRPDQIPRTCARKGRRHRRVAVAAIRVAPRPRAGGAVDVVVRRRLVVQLRPPRSSWPSTGRHRATATRHSGGRAGRYPRRVTSVSLGAQARYSRRPSQCSREHQRSRRHRPRATANSRTPYPAAGPTMRLASGTASIIRAQKRAVHASARHGTRQSGRRVGSGGGGGSHLELRTSPTNISAEYRYHEPAVAKTSRGSVCGSVFGSTRCFARDRTTIRTRSGGSATDPEQTRAMGARAGVIVVLASGAVVRRAPSRRRGRPRAHHRAVRTLPSPTATRFTELSCRATAQPTRRGSKRHQLFPDTLRE